MQKRWPVRLGVLALIGAAVLGYGYWRAWSRANIMMIIADASQGQGAAPAFVAELIVRDAGGTLLAQGRSNERFGTVSFIHPQHGSCEDEEKSALASAEGRARWATCIGAKFRWQAQWAPRAAKLDIRFAQCRVADIPLALRQRRDDWWLWWVPLPHVGGDPLTDFSAKVLVNAATCQARAAGFYE